VKRPNLALKCTEVVDHRFGGLDDDQEHGCKLRAQPHVAGMPWICIQLKAISALELRIEYKTH